MSGFSPAMPVRRVVVFTSGRNYNVCRNVVELVRRNPELELLVIEHRPPRTAGRLLRNQLRNLRRNGWRWIPYQATEVIESMRLRLWPSSEPLPGSPGAAYEFAAVTSTLRVRWRTVADVHAERTVALLHEYRPDLGISLGAPVLREVVFAVPRLGTINLHKGQLPDFRGMPPAFWEFETGATQFGCTVHRVVSALDAGDVLLEQTLRRAPHATPKGVQLELDEIGIELVCRAVEDIGHGRARWRAQQAGGQTFRKPTLGQIAAQERRLNADPRPLSERVKDCAFSLYRRLWRPIPRWLAGLAGRQRIVVLLYHRVNDDMRDSLTVGIEQFDRQLAWLARNCRLVCLEDIAAGRVDRRSLRPIVAVTFDDGYLDNSEIAGPIMLRHRVPATFFVSTGHIESEIAFEHDLKRKGHYLPTMSWAQLARLRDWGFTVGSHTVTHLDCGRAPIADVRRELEESRDHLVRHLGIERPMFAYPFGGPDNFTVEARAEVVRAGYSACVSAFGGFNSGPIDPYRIKRINISCHFSLAAFAARVEGMNR